MKRYFYLLLLLNCTILLETNAQWAFNTNGNNHNFGNTSDTDGIVTVTSSGGGVHGSIPPEGLVGTDYQVVNIYNNTYNVSELNTVVGLVLNNHIVNKWYKATVGKSETIQIDYQYRKVSAGNGPRKSLPNEYIYFRLKSGGRK